MFSEGLRHLNLCWDAFICLPDWTIYDY